MLEQQDPVLEQQDPVLVFKVEAPSQSKTLEDFVEFHAFKFLLGLGTLFLVCVFVLAWSSQILDERFSNTLSKSDVEEVSSLSSRLKP